MKKDYIKIYNNTYSKSEILAEKEIITKFIGFKERGRNSNKAGNVIVQEFGKEKSKCRVMDESFQSLFYLFRNRLDEFAEDYQMNIIPEILLPEFNKIINSDNFSFENYIKELAEFNARDSVHNTFSNNRSLYSLMFELNDFSEFSIIGCNGGNYSILYEKYRKKRYGEPSALNVISFDSANEINKKELKNFNIKNNELLDDDNYYNELTYDFICEKKTSFEDFKNVLMRDFETHTSEIHFFCSNFLIRQLIFSFKEKFGGKFNLSVAANSKKFRNYNGNYINAQSLSHSIIDEKDALTEEVKEILN